MLTELLQHRTATDHRQSSYTIRRTFDFNGHKIRATVAHDPYRNQASYYVEVFSPRDLKWNRVHTEPVEGWYNSVDALNTGKLTPEQWQHVDMLIQRLVLVASELLEGITA